MYAALWRALPGPAWAKVAQLLVLLALTLAVLFTWVFPVVSRLLPVEDVTVPDPAQFTTSTSSTGSSAGSSAGSSTGSSAVSSTGSTPSATARTSGRRS